ncbi:MAG: hypothetical protein HQK60_18450 [Deltaproteobacteria bacterium]|nr:hypothetical protein [Deltaproteobacteria bacterium]
MKIKKKKQKQKNVYDPLKMRLIHQQIAQPQNILIEPEGVVKMSEVLLEYIEPYAWETKEELYQLVSVAIIAWNAVLLSGDKRKDALEKMLNLLPAEIHDDVTVLIGAMIRRKEKYFAHIRRVIVNFHITMTKDGPHISVASTLSSTGIS